MRRGASRERADSEPPAYSQLTYLCVRAVRACGDVNVARGEEGRRLDAVRLLALGFGVWINVRPMDDEIVAFEQFRHPRK